MLVKSATVVSSHHMRVSSIYEIVNTRITKSQGNKLFFKCFIYFHKGVRLADIDEKVIGGIDGSSYMVYIEMLLTRDWYILKFGNQWGDILKALCSRHTHCTWQLSLATTLS